MRAAEGNHPHCDLGVIGTVDPLGQNGLLIERLYARHATIARALPEAFPEFIRQVAPAIVFMEGQGITTRLMMGYNTLKGWVIDMIPAVEPDKGFVAEMAGRGGVVEVIENGLPRATPDGLLSYVQARLGS